MPGLMSLRREYAEVQPLKGRISVRCMTVQTAVLIETLTALGMKSPLGLVQHLLRRISPPPPSWSARTAPRQLGVPVFAWKGRNARRIARWAARQMLYLAGQAGQHDRDDGGDATVWCCAACSMKGRRGAARRKDDREVGPAADPLRDRQGQVVNSRESVKASPGTAACCGSDSPRPRVGLPGDPASTTR